MAAKIQRQTRRTKVAQSRSATGIRRRKQITQSPGPRPKAQFIKLKVGHGLPFDQEDIEERERQFLRQQARNKTIARSLVGRDPATGRQAVSRRTFKRGQRVAAGRLKQHAGAVQLEVLDERAVTSSWVERIFLVMFNNQPALAIKFHSGFTALYPTTNIRDFEVASRAASKGKYIWAALYHGVPGAGAPYISIEI